MLDDDDAFHDVVLYCYCMMYLVVLISISSNNSHRLTRVKGFSFIYIP